MTPAEELTKLETAYSAWIDAGCPQSMQVDGRLFTIAQAEWMSRRIDVLRAAGASTATSGIFAVGQFRRPE